MRGNRKHRGCKLPAFIIYVKTPTPQSPLTPTEFLQKWDRHIVRACLRRTRGDAHQAEDIAQQVRMHLLKTTVPAFDPALSGGSSFYYTSINRAAFYLSRDAFAKMRRRIRTKPLIENCHCGGLSGVDGRIPLVAAAIVSNPLEYFSRYHMRVLRLSVTKPSSGQSTKPKLTSTKRWRSPPARRPTSSNASKRLPQPSGVLISACRASRAKAIRKTSWSTSKRSPRRKYKSSPHSSLKPTASSPLKSPAGMWPRFKGP